MKGTLLMTCLLSIAVGAGPTAQSSSAGKPPRLIIESMTGEDSFNFYCATCHGRDGRGTGPVATALKTQPSDLTALARRNRGMFPRSDVISFVIGTARQDRQIPATRSSSLSTLVATGRS